MKLLAAPFTAYPPNPRAMTSPTRSGVIPPSAMMRGGDVFDAFKIVGAERTFISRLGDAVEDGTQGHIVAVGRGGGLFDAVARTAHRSGIECRGYGTPPVEVQPSEVELGGQREMAVNPQTSVQTLRDRLDQMPHLSQRCRGVPQMGYVP